VLIFFVERRTELGGSPGHLRRWSVKYRYQAATSPVPCAAPSQDHSIGGSRRGKHRAMAGGLARIGAL